MSFLLPLASAVLPTLVGWGAKKILPWIGRQIFGWGARQLPKIATNVGRAVFDHSRTAHDVVHAGALILGHGMTSDAVADALDSVGGFIGERFKRFLQSKLQGRIDPESIVTNNLMRTRAAIGRRVHGSIIVDPISGTPIHDASKTAHNAAERIADPTVVYKSYDPVDTVIHY